MFNTDKQCTLLSDLQYHQIHTAYKLVGDIKRSAPDTYGIKELRFELEEILIDWVDNPYY